MDQSRSDVAVVGAGLVGLSIALALARRGTRVIVLEQYGPGHLRGSSHGDARIFRVSYPELDYVRLAQEALEGWQRLEADAGQALLAQVGGLDLGQEPDWRPNQQAMATAGVTHEVVEGRALSARFPGLRQLSAPALWQRDAGTLHADRCLRALREQLARCGGEVHDRWPVTAIEPGNSAVQLIGPSGRLDAGWVVLSAGPWMRGLTHQLGIELPLEVTLQTVSYVAVDGTPPPVLIDWSSNAPIYALPSRSGLVKVAFHGSSLKLNPEVEQREPDPAVADQVESALGELVSSKIKRDHLEACLYTSTPSEDFILDRAGRVVIASCCSGHGFKMGPAVGRLAADLVQGEEPEPRFSLSRFAA